MWVILLIEFMKRINIKIIENIEQSAASNGYEIKI